MPSKNSLEAVKKAQTSKIETISNTNLLATTVSDIRLWPSIDHAVIEAVNVKMATVMCDTVK